MYGLFVNGTMNKDTLNSEVDARFGQYFPVFRSCT